ncbi:MAG: DUF421 domain-containing protein [Mycoplasmatota bacterium]
MDYIIVLIIFFLILNTIKKQINNLSTFTFFYLLFSINMSFLFILKFCSFFTYVFIIVILSLFNYISTNKLKLTNIDNQTIIKNGVINFNQLIKSNISLDLLEKKLKENNILDISKINYAYINYKNNLIINRLDENYPVILLINNKVNKTLLRQLGKDIDWLNNILDKKNIDLNDLFCLLYLNEKILVVNKTMGLNV